MSQILIQPMKIMDELEAIKSGANICNCGCTIAKHESTSLGKMACKNCKNCGNFGRGKPLTAEQVQYCGFDMKEY